MPFVDMLSSSTFCRRVVAHRFGRALRDCAGEAPLLVLGHHDADGLSALSLLARALTRSDRAVQTRIVGRGENLWSSEMAAELAGMEVSGIIAADLGVREGVLKPGVPAVLIDHHVPATAKADGVVISGYGVDPVPTSSLLAYWCAGAVADAEQWLWLAALGLIGDLAENAGFPEMAQARKRYGISALRAAAALVNAPRRSASGDASPALALLMHADSPQDILSGEHPQTAQLIAARDEVRREMQRVKRTKPIIRDGVALIQFSSPCQIHPLVAQQWRSRLRDCIVLAANIGYRPGFVHFAVRSARDIDLIGFLARHAPSAADAHYGGGHRQATGGALRTEAWNAWIAALGLAEGRVE